MANSAAGGASDYNTQIINEFRANQGRVGGMWEGTTLILIHHIGARSGIERDHPGGLLPPARRPVRDLGRQRRIAHPPELVPQPQGPPADHRRGRHPDIHGPGARNWTAPPAPSCGPSWSPSGRSPAAGSPDLGAAQARTTRQFPVFLLTRQD